MVLADKKRLSFGGVVFVSILRSLLKNSLTMQMATTELFKCRHPDNI